MAGGDGALPCLFAGFLTILTSGTRGLFLLFVAQVLGVPARLPLGLAGTLRGAEDATQPQSVWPVACAACRSGCSVDQQRPHGSNHLAL